MPDVLLESYGTKTTKMKDSIYDPTLTVLGYGFVRKHHSTDIGL